MPNIDDNVIEKPVVKNVEKEKLEFPKQYKVIMMNDDFTPFEFVVHVLQKHFKKGKTEAEAVMMSIHQTGKGICGIYAKDVAETKAKEVMDEAKANGHPLMLDTEPES